MLFLILVQAPSTLVYKNFICKFRNDEHLVFVLFFSNKNIKESAQFSARLYISKGAQSYYFLSIFKP